MSELVVVTLLMSLRLLGFFMLMPMFALRSVPIRLRIALTLVMAVALQPMMPKNWSGDEIVKASYFFAMMELLIGLAAGFVMRMGFVVVEFLAEVLAIQSGLSFAASTFRDPVLQSGLMGELLGLLMLALAFLMNVHLLTLDVLLRSFQTVPFGSFPTAWNAWAMASLLQSSFMLGAILTLPAFVVYLFFNLTQAMLSRLSPQMNLFSIGFAISVPVAFVVLMLLLPAFPQLVDRVLQVPVDLLRQGLTAS